MLDLRTALLALAFGLAVGALGSWWLTSRYKDASWQASISVQKEAASKMLKEATEKALAVERKNVSLSNQLEILNVQSTKKLDQVLADNQRLARELGGLRDPGRRPSGGSPVPSASDATGELASGPTGTELSTEASEFLLGFARDADEAAQYAATCRAWINAVTH